MKRNLLWNRVIRKTRTHSSAGFWCEKPAGGPQLVFPNFRPRFPTGISDLIEYSLTPHPYRHSSKCPYREVWGAQPHGGGDSGIGGLLLGPTVPQRRGMSWCVAHTRQCARRRPNVAAVEDRDVAATVVNPSTYCTCKLKRRREEQAAV